MWKYTKRRLVANIGINDANYFVSPIINGKQAKCVFYKIWQAMIVRCYSKKSLTKYPSYLNVTVCEEWLTFMNFRAWMMFQDWRGKYLDKDIIEPGNKIYSPETCAFIDQGLNSLLTGSNKAPDDPLLGVTYEKLRKKFMAQCYDGCGNQIKLGQYDTAHEAHLAYVNFKIKIIKSKAKSKADYRISAGLLKHAKILEGTIYV